MSFLSYHKHASLQELLDVAVEFGATTGRKSYKKTGRDRLRNQLLDKIDEEQETELYNGPHGLHKATFGATMVVDGKDDFAGDHMLNYAEVTPHGYLALGFQEVIDLSRDNRWISRELIDAYHKASTSGSVVSFGP